jgi:predicted CopG family antitoxin
MGKTIHVSDEFHEFVRSSKEDDETFEEALRRLVRGHSLIELGYIFEDDRAEEIGAAVERADERDKAATAELRRSFEESDE